MVEHLIRAIAIELDIDLDKLDIARGTVQLAGQLGKKAADLSGKFKIAETFLGPIIQRYLNKRTVAQWCLLQSEIEKKLTGKKLIVFVDDVDRVRPELVPNLLLTLKEGLDHPDYSYVMALSPEVVERGLKMVHEGWGGPREFLEKIIELPKQLPHLTAREVAQFTNIVLQQFGPTVDIRAMADITPLLPSNPRKLKLLLRYIASLHGLLSRFSPDELDWRALYLCQMLRLEFPDESRALMFDEKAIEDMEVSWLRDQDNQYTLRRDNLEKEEDIRPEFAYAPCEPRAKERFLSVCNALRQRSIQSRGRYGLARLFLLSDDPPVFTFGELNAQEEQFQKVTPETRPELLRKTLMNRKGDQLNARKVQALIGGIIELRQDQLHRAADTDLEEKLKERLRIADGLLEILKVLIVDLKVFRSDILAVDSWDQIFKHFASWSHFAKPDYYQEVREKERDLLRNTLFTMSPALQSMILDQWLSQIDPPRGKSEAFNILVSELRDTLEQTTSEQLLRSFESPDGIETFWAIDLHAKGKAVLFGAGSCFHQKHEFRNRLKKVSQRSSLETEIQQNFLTYFRMLCYGAYKMGSSFPREECRLLLQDAELLQLVWTAAVAQPLNPRIFGSLREDKRNLPELGISLDLLPTPLWWQRLEQEFFEPEVGSSTGSAKE